MKPGDKYKIKTPFEILGHSLQKNETLTVHELETDNNMIVCLSHPLFKNPLWTSQQTLDVYCEPVK